MLGKLLGGHFEFFHKSCHQNSRKTTDPFNLKFLQMQEQTSAKIWLGVGYAGWFTWWPFWIFQFGGHFEFFNLLQIDQIFFLKTSTSSQKFKSDLRFQIWPLVDLQWPWKGQKSWFSKFPHKPNLVIKFPG